MKDDLAEMEEKKTCLDQVKEEMDYDSDKERASTLYSSTETSFINSGPDVRGSDKTDAASALDISDSELLCQKQKKPHALDALFALADADVVDENVAGNVLPAATIFLSSTPTAAGAASAPPPSQAPVQLPEVDASSFIRAVRSFPLPPEQQHRPVVGPPSLDEDMLRRMEQLHIPVSLPQEDVERVARLEQLKQLSCRD